MPLDLSRVRHAVIVAPHPDDEAIGAFGLIHRLRRRGVRTYLATNQQSYRGAHMQANLPYAARMDGVFYSYELGHAKPSPAFFQAILDATQDEPSSVLFIDDVEANVEGARAVGVHAAWVDRDLGFAEVRRVLSEHGLDHEPEPARR